MWLRSIPREWDPDIDISSARIYVCEKHFNDNDFQTDRTDSHSTRKKVKGKQLKRKRLKKDVVPSKWPGIPSYLSKEPFVPRPTSTTSSTLRTEAQTERDKIKYGFTTIEELKNKFDRSILPLSIVDIWKEHEVNFIAFTTVNEPTIKYSLKILHSLDYEVWLEGNKVNLSGSVNDKISKMPKRLTSIIEIKEILDYLEDAPLSSDEDIISNIIRKLKQPRFEDNKVIAFIVEQLSLLYKSPRQRRYSPSMLAMTCMLERMSPSCYNQMYRDAWIILPTADYLRRLTSAINVDLDISPSTISYLTARFSRLAKKDKVVSLLMDEVYSRKMVQYTNGKFYGIENGAPTRTVLCVMLKSVAGRY